MRILALDTATSATAAAHLDTATGTEVQARDDPPPGVRPRHTTKLISLLTEVLQRSGSDWAELDRIAVGVGPGTFTGLRIGVATARALARAHGVPLVGVSTLQSLALGAAGAEATSVVMPVLDARRGEVFAAAWPARRSASSCWDPLLAPLAVTPQSLAELAPQLGADRLAVGDGSVAFRAVLECSGTRVPEDDSELHRVSAINHCRLAGGQPPQDPAGVRPQYLRLPDAELARRATQRK
ncbi:MAG TPA: tRNA (adenosine(37)-N6)-threonylcarbamoyltransferase complex dimerization subunit type 1 TsaB [Solirubrobacteraceae bacterium]